jgi:hypothetical protein
MNDTANDGTVNLRDRDLAAESAAAEKADATVWRIRFPPEADSKKQGQLGLDADAPREALDLIPCERGTYSPKFQRSEGGNLFRHVSPRGQVVPYPEVQAFGMTGNRIRHTAARAYNMAAGIARAR